MHNYHDTYGTFPPGKIEDQNFFTQGGQTTWPISILSFIDQAPVYNLYNFNLTVTSPGNAFIRDISLPIYNCPSDPLAGQSLIPGRSAAYTQRLPYRASSYKGMGGKCMPYLGSPDRLGWGSAAFLIPTSIWPVPDEKMRGMLHWTGGNLIGGVQKGRFNPVRARDIIDGTSNTLAVGEYTNLGDPTFITATASVVAGAAYAAEFWAYTYDHYSVGCASTTLGAGGRGLIGNFERCSTLGNSNLCERGFGSGHPGSVVNFVRGDGSVIGISPSVDIGIYGSLATIAGGEVVGDF